jgi:hypothetical protein
MSATKPPKARVEMAMERYRIARANRARRFEYFLALPPEIRVIVYNSIFQRDKPLFLSDESR